MQKRRSTRIIKRLEVKFISAGVSYTGITSNLSSHGIFIRTKKGLAPGTTLEIELRLPTGEAIKLDGVVKRTVKTQFQDVKNGMGVELKHIPPKYTAFLNTIP
jgi:uncharacterized protein (TIGR02266 family)